MRAVQQIQLRHLFKVVSGATPETGNQEFWDGEIVWITPEDVSQVEGSGVIFNSRRKITEIGYKNCGTTIAPSNSIVLTKRAPIGQLAILGVEACSNQGCFLLIPKLDVYSKFYYYFLFSQKERLQILGRGSTFMELSTDEIKSLYIPNLNSLQQRRIAAYLDRETARIDALIAAKERLLTLLEEKRQALITRAVTRGLDPNVKLKDSGIGEVPEGWVITRLKYVMSKIGSGVTPKGGAEVYLNEGIPFLRSQNIHFDGIKTEDMVFISDEIHHDMSGSAVKKGDVLLNITGASIGRCYFFEGQFREANVNQHVCILRPNTKKVLTKYLYYFLASELGQSQVEQYQTGGGREGLNFESLKSFIIPLPSLKEQAWLIDRLDDVINKIKLLHEDAERSIALLKERRSVLISACVTGQLEIKNHEI